MQPAVKVALRITRQGGEYLKSQFLRMETGPAALADMRKSLEATEAAIYESCAEQLRRAYRDYHIAPAGVIDAREQPQSWHILPLIGAENFIRGVPEFAIALVQKQKNRAEHLVLINPVSGEEYAVSRGHGAALNSRRIRANELRDPTQGLCITDLFVGHWSATTTGEVATELKAASNGLRSTQCALLDLARLAAGRADMAVLLKPSAADLSIGLLLAHESGLITGDLAGNPLDENSKNLVAANNRLFKPLIQSLQGLRASLNSSEGNHL